MGIDAIEHESSPAVPCLDFQIYIRNGAAFTVRMEVIWKRAEHIVHLLVRGIEFLVVVAEAHYKGHFGL